MSILLCLSDTCLLQIVSCKELSECICDLFLHKCNQFIRNRHIILCEAYICGLYSFASVKSCEIIITECSCDLSCTVRTEVKEDNGISVFYRRCRSAVFHNYHRHNELICHILIIRSLNSLYSGICLISLSIYESSVGFLYAVPAVITIHCIVASCNCSDLAHTDFFHLCFQLFYILFSGCRRCVTSVKEAVYIYFLDSLSLCQLKESVNVRIVAVYASVRYESHQMKCRIVFLYILTRFHKRFILKEISILDRLCDLCKILVYDTACTHVQMSYLRVSHLSVRKSYCHTAGISFHERALSHQFVHNRCSCLCNSITMLVIS